MKYTIKIFFSEEDEGYIALAEELDSISAFGKTEEEALKELKNAISLYFIDKMPEENISRVIELIKSNEYLDEALEMENKRKLITKTIEELENYIY